MNLIRISLAISFAILLSFDCVSQRAKDGDYNASTANNIVNTYTFLTANAAAGNIALTVDDNTMTGGVFGGNLAPGDLILIIQMQGANMDYSTNPITVAGAVFTSPIGYDWNWWEGIDLWGQVTAYNNSGKFEQIEVLSVSGANTINLQCALKNSYDQTGKVQIVRVPRFDNLSVTGGSNAIIPAIWDGQVGGIVAIEAETNVDISGGSSISASEFGFRGGELDNVSLNGDASAPDQTRFLGTFEPGEGSEKGEGIYGYHAEYDLAFSRYGISGAANGGGGAGYQNCGGGGGSNIGAGAYTGNGIPIGTPAIWDLEFAGFGGSVSSGGGRGGYALAFADNDETTNGPNLTLWAGDARKNNGGRGGHPLAYDATRMFFGGGGGAGEQDNGEAGAGGRGGGIVYLTCYGTISGSGTMEVNGQDGQKTNPANNTTSGGNTRRGNDGAGGGGAAGAIYIENATAIPGSIILDAVGGDGGDQVLLYNSVFLTREADGPGGSGTGGSISFGSGAPTQNLSAGIAGVTNSPYMNNFMHNGATEGAPGVGNLSSPFFDIIGSDVAICAGDVANLSVTLVGVAPGTINWYTQQFGGASINTGLTYSTPALGSTTTYYVGACPSTFRIPIIVTIAPLDDPAFTTVDFCESSVNVISGVALTGGTYAITAQTGAATIALNTGILSGYTAGDQITIEYTTPAGACQNTSSQIVNVTPQDNAAFTTVDFCESSVNVISGVALPGGTYAITAQTGTASIDLNTGILSGYTAGDQITIEYTTPAGACQNTSTQIVTVTPLPVLTLNNPAPVCSPATVDITAGAISSTDAGTMLYYSDIGMTIAVPDATIVGNGTYYVEVTNNGCTSNGSVTVIVVTTPEVFPQLEVVECDSYVLPIITGAALTGAQNYFDATGGPLLANVVTGPITSSATLFIYDGLSGCSDEEILVITINPLPSVSLVVGGGTYCEGDVVSDILVDVTGSANWSVDYTLDGAVQNATGATSPINLGNSAGAYVVTNVMDANCPNTVTGSQIIVVNPIPSAPLAGADSEYCSTVEPNLMTVAGGSGTFTWYSDAGLTTILGTGTTLNPNQIEGLTTYYVTETEFGCEGLASSISVTINSCDVTIPTAFTPDGDGMNDDWEILDIDKTYPNNIVYVYNRWGDLLFTSDQGSYDTNRWDGKSNGGLLPVGSYYFIIEYNDPENNMEKGVVSIILNK